MIVDKLVGDSIKSIFQSERDRLRNADEPHMMRPKNNRKSLKGAARILYLERKVKLSKADLLVGSGLGLSRTKILVKKNDFVSIATWVRANIDVVPLHF